MFNFSLNLLDKTQKSLTLGNADQIVVIHQYTDKLNSDLENINKIINAPGRSTLYRSMFEGIPTESSSNTESTHVPTRSYDARPPRMKLDKTIFTIISRMYTHHWKNTFKKRSGRLTRITRITRSRLSS